MKTSHPVNPVLLIVSAPSGAGKTTLCRRLMEECGDTLQYSVSWTTRPPRSRESDGEHYRFVDESAFLREVERGGFLEFARVHGYWYGTPKSSVETALAAGIDVIMDIDVQGAAQIRETLRRIPELAPLRAAFADVFIRPPSLAELRRRLETRGQDAPDVIERRIRQAHAEMNQAGEYRYWVTNDELDRAYDALRSILIAERHRNRTQSNPPFPNPIGEPHH